MDVVVDVELVVVGRVHVAVGFLKAEIWNRWMWAIASETREYMGTSETREYMETTANTARGTTEMTGEKMTLGTKRKDTGIATIEHLGYELFNVCFN